MSARSLAWKRPELTPSDAEQVLVSRRDLRELDTALAFLRAVAEANDASDPDDPLSVPADLAAVRDAADRVRNLVAAPTAQPTGSSPRPTSVTDLCDALAEQTGCDPTRADKLAADLATFAEQRSRVLLDDGTPCAPASVRRRVGALLLTAAAKRLAG